MSENKRFVFAMATMFLGGVSLILKQFFDEYPRETWIGYFILFILLLALMRQLRHVKDDDKGGFGNNESKKDGKGGL